MDTAPKASGCFLGGTQEIIGAVSEDLLGGTGKAEDAKLQGAGIIPKQCPMERAGMERMDGNAFGWCSPEPELRKNEEQVAWFQSPLAGRPGALHFLVRKQHIANRELRIIEKIDARGNLQLRFDSGRTVAFNVKGNPHLDYGCAVTSHSSQGQTADRVLVHIDTEQAGEKLIHALSLLHGYLH